MKVVPPDTDDRFRGLGMPTTADPHFAETGTHKLEGGRPEAGTRFFIGLSRTGLPASV